MKEFILFLILIASYSVSAHSGRTNAGGCHDDIKRNEYHCHSSEIISLSDPQPPPKSANKSLAIDIKKYNRKDWPHWIDADKDCQDTRAEILIRDTRSIIKYKRSKPCNVSWGEWLDPYTNQTFYKASDIDIDHIVPLAHAHKMGGKLWSRKQKRAFANDFENLLAIEDNVNQSKGAKPPQRWMPDNREFHCKYLNKWKYIKAKYHLKSTKDEVKYIHNAMNSAGC